MSAWTHSQCGPCWTAANTDEETGEVREPVRLNQPPMDTCCFCGMTTAWGIYVREDPEGLICSKPGKGHK